MIISCNNVDNPVLEYFENAELQYEGKTQEDNIVSALNDILVLSERELKLKKYKDYEGNKGKWDLPTFVAKYFVPGKKEKTLGSNFYHYVKTGEMKKRILKILEQIKNSPWEE